MSRKVVRMTLDHLAELEGPCRSCVFWELDPVRRDRVDEPAAEKEAWMSYGAARLGLVRTGRRWWTTGPWATRSTRRRRTSRAPARFPTAPVSNDAVLLSAVYVDPEARGGGLGRMLVQGMARDLIERGGIARRRGVRGHPRPGMAGAGRCVVPVEFLTSVGFKTQRAHAVTPRMRMDLRSALSWRDEVEAALERLLGAVRPAPKTRADHPTARPAMSRTLRPRRR